VTLAERPRLLHVQTARQRVGGWSRRRWANPLVEDRFAAVAVWSHYVAAGCWSSSFGSARWTTQISYLQASRRQGPLSCSTATSRSRPSADERGRLMSHVDFRASVVPRWLCDPLPQSRIGWHLYTGGASPWRDIDRKYLDDVAGIRVVPAVQHVLPNVTGFSWARDASIAWPEHGC